MRSDAVIDLLLTDAAEALIRNRAKRPPWLPAGFPMKLILTLKRQALIDHICEDPQLRKYLRVSSRRLLDQAEPDLDASTFNERVQRSDDPHRLVARALVHEDDEVARTAAPWAHHIEHIPVVPVPANEPPATEGAKARRRVKGRRRQEAGGGANEALKASESSAEVDPPSPPEPGAPGVMGGDQPTPVWDQRERLELIEERERLRRRVRQLEAENVDLRSRVPSRSERRRYNKEHGQLKRLEAELQEVRQELEALRSERDRLIELRHELEVQLEEAEDSKAAAQRKSQLLERRLSSIEGRVEYLRRSLEGELAAVDTAIESLRAGQELTRLRRQRKNLVALQEALDACYPRESPAPAERQRRVVVKAPLDLTVTPLGGGEEIGGSAILVEAGGRKILVDAGLHPDGRGPTDIQSVVDGGRLDAIVVTHAHNDHAGYVPALVDRFRNIPVVCSDATASLLPTMWTDSAKVMDRSFAESPDGLQALPPLYTAAEVERAEERIRDQPYHREFPIGDLRLILFPAGHILGAAGVVITAGDKRVVITGDISGLDDHYLSVESAHLPERLVADADLLVIETTYCQESHGHRERQEAGLVGAVKSVVDRRGRVLIPAFGLGRSQEVVLILRKHLPEVEVLIDGLAKDISTIYEKVAEGRGQDLTIVGGRVRPVRNRFRELQSFHSGAIVSSSGMLTGGPSVSWAKSILPDERAALLLCGFQDEEAPGRRLERLASSQPGPQRLTLPDYELGTVDIDVRADVHKYALSAHADRPALLDIIERIRPRHTMLVHGLREKQTVFRRELRDRGVVTVPTLRWQSCA